jgi:uncharacterized repeat protein (TIGR02543 family)
MTLRKRQNRKHSQTYKTREMAYYGRIPRLFLSLLLVALLIPQLPAYAVDPSSADAAAADISSTGEPLPAREEATFATLAEAEDAGAVASVPDDPDAFIQNEVIVILAGEDSAAHELATVEDSLSALSDTDDAIETELLSPDSPDSPDGSTALVELPADVSVQDALLELANDDRVAFAQPNYRYTLLDDNVSEEEQPLALESLLVPNDPAVSDLSINGQWWLETVKAFEAWEQQKVNKTVGVAVIDTGVRRSHDDLRDNIDERLAWDAYRNQPLATSVSKGQIGYDGDVSYHGTFVSGVIAAKVDNNLLGAGVSYNATIVPINIFHLRNGGNGSTTNSANTTADTSTVVKAFDYIIKHRTEANIRVVNMSFGGYAEGDDDRALHQMIKDAKDKYGILSVAAAGNSNTSNACYPSDYTEVVSVTAVNKDLSRWISSDYNVNKDIAAPGNEVYTTRSFSNNDACLATGTSLAAPIVSGIAALLFAKNPNLTPDEVKDLLCKTATDLTTSPGSVGRDNYFGWGLVNAQAALTAVPANHTVTLNPNGGSISSPTITKPHNSTIGDLPKPTRSGYLFTGWFTAASGGDQVTSATKVTIDVTYYAHWAAIAPVTQHAGATRFETATMASQKAYPDPTKVNAVIVSFSHNFPDALAASYLAGAVDAPILLTSTTTLYPATLAEINRLSPQTVYITGSTQVIGSGVEQTLKNLSFKPTVIRLAGAIRTQTAVAIANEAKRIGGTPQTAFVVYDSNYPDALSVGSLSASRHVPILLTEKETLSFETQKYLLDNNIKDIIVIGGPPAVSDRVVTQLKGLSTKPTVVRWSGSDRYATAKDVIDKATAKWNLKPTAIGIALGDNFPDALVGGAAMGNRGGILVISPTKTLSDAARNVIAANKTSIQGIEVFGGTNVIDVRMALSGLLS